MTKQFFFNNFEIVIGSIIGIIGIIVGVAGIIVGIIISNNSTKTVKNFILTTLVKGTDIALQSSKVPGKKFKLSNLEKEALFKNEYDIAERSLGSGWVVKCVGAVMYVIESINSLCCHTSLIDG